MREAKIDTEAAWTALRQELGDHVHTLKVAFVFDNDETDLGPMRAYYADGSLEREDYADALGDTANAALWDLRDTATNLENRYWVSNGVYKYDLDQKEVKWVGDAYVPEPKTVIEWGD